MRSLENEAMRISKQVSIFVSTFVALCAFVGAMAAAHAATNARQPIEQQERWSGAGSNGLRCAEQVANF